MSAAIAASVFGSVVTSGMAAQAVAPADAIASTLTLYVPSGVGAGYPIEIVANLGPSGEGEPGTVDFMEGGVSLPGCASVAVNITYAPSTAQCPITYPVPGSHTLTATYTTNDPSAVSSSTALPLTFQILQASTMTLSASPNPVVYGQPFTVTATVHGPILSPAPTGTVTIFGGSSEAGGCIITLVAGTGTCTTPNASTYGTVSAGPAVPIQAAYSGDTNYARTNAGGAIQTPTTIDIEPAPVTITLTTSSNPAYASNPPQFNATVHAVNPTSGIPVGLFTFTANGQVFCGPETGSSGQTSIGCSESAQDALQFNSGTIVASFTGQTNYGNATSAPIQQVVRVVPTTITASASPNPVRPNTNVLLVASVTGPAGMPEGNVTFTDGNQLLCTAVVPATPASCFTKALAPGVDTVTASYADTEEQMTIGAGAPQPEPYDPSSTTFKVNVTGPSGNGYWLVGGDGGIFTFGSAPFEGSTGALQLQRPVVGITATTDESGYWLVASDGGIFSFGDTRFYGSIPQLGFSPAGSSSTKKLAAPIVAMVPSADQGGYFMVGSDGGVFAFGDAKFAGSCPGIGGCSGAAIAVMPDASGQGYWLVTKTGHVYTFGDAFYYGAPNQTAAPVTSAVRTPDGGGYWILVGNGTVFAYGDANRYSAIPGSFNGLNPATAIMATSDGGGYWVTSATGSVYPYGDAPNDGGMAGQRLNAPIIAAAGY